MTPWKREKINYSFHTEKKSKTLTRQNIKNSKTALTNLLNLVFEFYMAKRCQNYTSKKIANEL
jgi:hypothetical protein